MKELLEYILNGIYGKDFRIEERSENGLIHYIILVPQNDIGLIIGKQGKTIKAIRNLLKVRATLEKKGVTLSVEPLA